ncbi:hypothetical protein ABIE62_000835 [Porphyrobacter sp. MBR-155]|jgi:hypothetical protein|uniref:heparinase II/III domain-containing protein n=1 Tax=Porphyrobacter sp. MBR-155 TaxID=3156464 RepID=UPI003399A475
MFKEEIIASYTIDAVPLTFGGVTTEMADRAMGGELYVPTFGFFKQASPNDFELQGEKFDNTMQLWHHTLPSVLALLKTGQEQRKNHFIDRALDITERYLNWLSSQPLSHPAWKDEHAVANRLRLLNYYVSKQDNGQIALSASLARAAAVMAQSHADWCARESSYVWNNHGLMSDRALLESAVVQRHVPVWQRTYWADTALNRARKLLDKTFDSCGCCTENSPAYHMLNMMLFRDFVSFCKKAGYVSELDVFTEKLELAEMFAGFFVRKNGTYATIGDTELHPTHWIDSKRYAPQTGTTVSPESGFFIHKTDNLYFTAKCGGSTFVHRHVDETSITLQHQDVDFILDAGLYKFSTQTDQQARWFRSSRAHSGVFTEDCDNIRFANFEGPTHLGAISEIWYEGEDAHCEMKSFLSERAMITRTVIIVSGDQEIQISDKVQSRDNEEINWFVTFIIPGEATIQKEDDAYQITCGEESIKLYFSVNSNISIFKTLMSKQFGVCEDAYALVVSGRDNSKNLKTRIVLGG